MIRKFKSRLNFLSCLFSLNRDDTIIGKFGSKESYIVHANNTAKIERNGLRKIILR